MRRRSRRTCSVGTKRCGDGPLPALPLGGACVVLCRALRCVLGCGAARVGLGGGFQRCFGLVGDAAFAGFLSVGLAIGLGIGLRVAWPSCRVLAAVLPPCPRRGRRLGWLRGGGGCRLRSRRRLGREQQRARREDGEQDDHQVGVVRDCTCRSLGVTGYPEADVVTPSPKSRAESRRSVTPECSSSRRG